MENAEEGVSNQSETEGDKTSEYITLVKEKAALKAELSETTRELNKSKGNNYDLTKKVELLENENKELKKELQNVRKKGPKKRPARRKVPRTKKNVQSKNIDEEEETAFDDQETLYEKIAEQFPELPLSQVIVAEKKFVEADINRDGTIDAEELEKMLDTASLLFTKNDVREILKQIDVDGTNSLDFMECLKVCDTLHKNRKSTLPQSIQQNRSALCVLQ